MSGSNASTALVTGAASGMGRILAERLARRGTRVHALDRDGDALEVLAKEHPTIVAHPVDVTDLAALEAVVRPLADEVDLLVTAAGIGHTGLLVDTPPALLERLMRVNYLGTVSTIAWVLPAMQAKRRGRSVVFASMAGWVPAREHAPYNATKAALVMYSEILQLEAGDSGIHVHCVCPPAVDTPLLDAMPASKAGLKYIKAMTPERVVDAIESAMAADRFWVFPDTASKVLWRLRRHTPRLLHGIIRRILPK
jgi:short-subunit dehydrogenase